MAIPYLEKLSGKEKSANSTKPTKAPAEKAIILVCEKCGHNSHASSKELKSELKNAAKEAFGKKGVRVVLTSCMSICPKGGIAVALAPTQAGSGTEYLVVEGGAEEAAREILGRLP